MPSEEIDGVVISSFPNASTIENNDVVTGLHNGNNANFLFSGIAAYIRQGLSNIFVPWSRIGTPNGAASLDSTGKVPSSQLPSTPSDASDITYDSTTSGLSATNVQNAIDEVQGEIGNLPSPPAPSDANPQDLGTAAAGSSADYSRADHVHNKPTAGDIGAQDTITANGILKGDGQGGVSAAVAGTDYQAPLTFDNTPTANSTNPVQSGGVYTDVRTRVPNYGKGKNLLRNWYFVGGGTGRGVFPVNQRGQTSYTAAAYTIDGWRIPGGANRISVDLRSDCIRIIRGTAASGSGIRMTLSQTYSGVLTISALVSSHISAASGSLTVLMRDANNSILVRTSTRITTLTGGELLTATYSGNGNPVKQVDFVMSDSAAQNDYADLYAVKLELGTEQTLCHNEGTDANPVWVLNEIPDYEYELYRCITSAADSTDTYANKSLATEQQIAYVESGTTASRNYEMEEWIAWQGKLCKTDKGFSAGTTFYTTGGNKNLTEEESGGFNAVNRRQALINGNVIFEVSGRTAIFRSNDNAASSTDIRNTIIPQYYRPKGGVAIPISYYNGSSWVNDGRFLRVYSGAGNVIISNLLGGIDSTLTFTHSVFCATWTF